MGVLGFDDKLTEMSCSTIQLSIYIEKYEL